MTPGVEPARTEDGRYLVIDGRRWRARDPAIPEALRTELVAELMAARRAVRYPGEDGVRAARDRVQDAKVALGERGEPWWEPTESGQRTRLAAAIRTLLRHREPDRTICPSDAARTVGGAHWRPLMPLARAVAGELAEQGVIDVRQRGEPVDLRSAKGPARLARGPEFG